MKDRILELRKKHGSKHFSRFVKKDLELWEWIISQTPKFVSISNSERIYLALNVNSNICSNNKQKKFKNFDTGYGFCGKTGICECARQSVSKNVSETKQKALDEERQKTSKKRKNTNLKKYGVENTGQTEYARLQHKNFYADKLKVADVIERFKQMCLEKYGVDNPKKSPFIQEKMKDTFLARYGVDNPSKIPSVKDKLRVRQAMLKESGTFLTFGYNRVSDYFLREAHLQLVTPINDYLGVAKHQELEFKCIYCGTTTTSKPYYGGKIYCRTCHPTVYNFVSNEETQIFSFLTNDLGLSVQQSNRTLINPYELDIIVPDKKIAIEYSGLYWHSEISGRKDKSYHAMKHKLVLSAGYSLITIFSDEWLYKTEIVKSVLQYKLGASSSKFNARECIVKEIGWGVAKKFLDKWHLQGSGTAPFKSIGIYADQVLLAVMTFSKPRKALMQKNNNSVYELMRFATNGSNIRGGAGKLFSYFIKSYNPEKVISYADNRWSTGNLYKMLGFTFEGCGVPGYWYTSDYITRHHRYNFRKQVLKKLDPSYEMLTEWEIMRLLSYDRIWDCGHSKWVWTK